MKLSTFLITATLGISFSVQAAVITETLYKLSDNGTKQLDANGGWNSTGGFNEGVSGAADAINNGLDYKNSIVDSWSDDFLSVRVSMLWQGTEMAFLEFGSGVGIDKTNFFSLANLTSSSWSDTGIGGNYFSINGHEGSNPVTRNWFVNKSYAGCASDYGWMVVLDGADTCNYGPWANGYMDNFGALDRAFLYSTSNTYSHYGHGWAGGIAAGTNTGTHVTQGLADTFIITAQREVSDAPEPSILAIFGLGLAGLGIIRRKKQQA